MSDNDTHRPIESELQAWAQARRDAAGGPFELHPVSRRLLQDEVARLYPPGEEIPAPPIAWWRLLGPRLAFASALAALAVVAVLQWTPGPESSGSFDLAKTQTPSLAENEAVSAPPPEPEPAPSTRTAPAASAPVPAVIAKAAEPEPPTGSTLADVPAAVPADEPDNLPPAVVRRRAQPLETSIARDSSEREPERVALAPVRSPRPASTADRGESASMLQQRYGLAASQPAAATGERFVATAATPSPPEPAIERTQDAQFSNTQRFTQVMRYRPNFNSPPRPPILESFVIEQTGEQLRVVDADGSVYEGRLELPADIEPGGVQAQATAGAAAQQMPTAEAQFRGAGLASNQTALFENRFRVVGRNLTANVPVIFEGTLSGDPGQLAQTVFANQAPTAAVANQQQQLLLNNFQNQLQLPNARIRGQATFGNNSRLQIEAAPANP